MKKEKKRREIILGEKSVNQSTEYFFSFSLSRARQLHLHDPSVNSENIEIMKSMSVFDNDDRDTCLSSSKSDLK